VLFDVERELIDDRDFSAVATVLGDCGDRAKMSQVFERYRPTVVFHAAAYKHVALLEANPLGAVRNNALATRGIANVAVEYGAARFVLVSTDKAANPKNLLGQSKALCEWIVEAYGHRADIKTRFVAVRFGNVLNSSGSVIPIFRRQIEKGGPVTVTHPEMTRYFMTIPEAVSLIVQAGAIGGRGQVYVLDMGEPVKILDLARNMIRLSGKEPETEIPIAFVGVRPGEKLHEELWTEGETVGPTSHPKSLLADRRRVARGGACGARADGRARRHARRRFQARHDAARAAARRLGSPRGHSPLAMSRDSPGTCHIWRATPERVKSRRASCRAPMYPWGET